MTAFCTTLLINRGALLKTCFLLSSTTYLSLREKEQKKKNNKIVVQKVADFNPSLYHLTVCKKILIRQCPLKLDP